MQYLLLAMALGIIPGAIAHNKNRSFLAWWLFGTMLWIIATPMIIVAKPLLGPEERERLANTRSCPECAEPILRQAKKCKHCGSEVEPLPEVRPVPENDWI